MKTPAKLTGDQRRAAILLAVRQVFAEKGFDGVTTRELAEAAGVSEALLFKHFPNKEAIYSAMQDSCCTDEDRELYERLQSLPPSASTLVLLVHYLVTRVVRDRPVEEEAAVIGRLMLRSLAGDGHFSRMLYRCAAEKWAPKVAACLKSAAREGKLVGKEGNANLGAWLAHHLAMAIMFHECPDDAVVAYGVSRRKLSEQAVRFILRGLGLKETVIDELYNPKALSLFE
ncbi:MAG: TetR/AcrR family transcriptional regulator [Gemmataceae bacterium]|nr:TetR/AcrR family transcriptional regulator [Gemmataceae bacterium]